MTLYYAGSSKGMIPIVAGEESGCWKTLACGRDYNQNLLSRRFSNQRVLRLFTVGFADRVAFGQSVNE